VRPGRPASPRRAAGLVLLVATVLGIAPSPGAQIARPDYLPFAEFGSQDTREQIAAKRDYNQAIHRYNQALYEYHVTLERHDRLTEIHNAPATDPAERQRARAEAERLRVKIADLAGDVKTRAAEVDQAWRRAADAGVSITR
jgi:hypothetical protein